MAGTFPACGMHVHSGQYELIWQRFERGQRERRMSDSGGSGNGGGRVHPGVAVTAPSQPCGNRRPHSVSSSSGGRSATPERGRPKLRPVLCCSAPLLLLLDSTSELLATVSSISILRPLGFFLHRSLPFLLLFVCLFVCLFVFFSVHPLPH